MKLNDKSQLPKEFEIVKPELLAQAVRVHLANQRQGTQSALTRAEISRTRKKYQKQKGSGNARHGDRKAPIFVGGGIAFAPKPRDHSLGLSAKMRKAAILGALALKNKEKELAIVSDMSKLTGKTSEVAQFFAENLATTKKVLIVTDEFRNNIYMAARNIPGVAILPMNQVNVYEILKADKVLMMEEALEMKEVKQEKKVEVVKEKVEVKKPVVKKAAVKKPVTKKAK